MTVFRVLRSPAEGSDGGAGVGLTIRDQYRLDAVLGRGTIGTVFRALDLQQGRPVALKLFDPAIDPEEDEARRMLADLETASGLLNPHIVPALDAGVAADNQLFVVEPLLEGQSLGARIAREPLPPMEAVRVALEVLVALDALHRHLLNHHDLHPENIFVVRDAVGFERVLVGGVGQHHALALDHARGRADGDTRARAEYLAPELISGKPRDIRTDIYQLGLVMYAMLTGDPPFVGPDPRKVARRHALERPASPQNKRPEAGVPDALDMVVVRALEKVPRKRYGSAMEMTRALEQVARKGAAAADTSSGRFPAAGLSGLHRLPPESSAPPAARSSESVRRPLTGSMSGSSDGSSDDRPWDEGRSAAESMEEAAPFADFDAEPPPAGPPTQLDVRQLLSPPPKITRPPKFGEAVPDDDLDDEREARATPPIASGQMPADDDETAHVAPVTEAFEPVRPDTAATTPETAAYDEAPALSQTAVSSQTLVDPLFRPRADGPGDDAIDGVDDKDDTGAHKLGDFPGAALVGTDDGRGVDNEATRAPTGELSSTLIGGPRPGMEAAVEADLSERTAFDGGAASKAAAAAVAAADGLAAAETRGLGDVGPESTSDGPADDGPSELGAAPAAGDEGWSVGAGAVDEDIDRALPRKSKAPWIIAALVVIGVGAFLATREGPAPAEPPDETPERIAIGTVDPPAAPIEPEALPEPEEPGAPGEPAAPDTSALEARARAALAAESWRGTPDALAETLAELRAADPDLPVIRELSTRGAERLLEQSRAAVEAKDLRTAQDRAGKALAVHPGFAPAERQLAEVARLSVEASREQAAADAQAQQAAAAKAEQEAAEREAAEKAEREAAEKAAREKAEREAAEKAAADEARKARQKAADDEAARNARQKAADDEAARKARQKAAADRAQAEAAEAIAAAERARREQAEAEQAARQKAADEARKKAEADARTQARAEAQALLTEGRGHVRGARWADARRAFEQALERDGRLAAAHAGLGEVAFQEQRFAEAVTHHRRSVQFAGGNAGYWNNLGMAYFKLQNYAQAKASWQKALELDSGNAKAQRYLELVEKKL